MSAEGLDELEIKLDQLADVDLNKAIGNAIQTVRSAAVMNVHVEFRTSFRLFLLLSFPFLTLRCLIG